MIYLDYSATTPVDKKVLQKMTPYFTEIFANPASIHTSGQTALKAVEDARYKIADLISAHGSEIIFTSGATEANNLALRGILKAAKNKGDQRQEIITSSIEHDSILEPLNYLSKEGYKIIHLPVNKQGLVEISKLQQAINENTILVSLGLVNSEIGSIQPINRFGRMIKKLNQHRYSTWLKTSPRKRGDKPKPIYFHTDATQAFNSLECNVLKLHVDALSLSGHKLYGPKGSGLLFLKRNTPLEALQYGGHQERNLRSGTLNVPGIIGLAEAMVIANKERKNFVNKVSGLRNYFVKKITKLIPQAILTVDLKNVSPTHAHFLFPGVTGDALLVALDELGVAVSTGSACASGDISISHVIRALGYKEALARSALRFTLGKTTNKKELDQAALLTLKAYKKCLNMIR
jgi:cysteine desulfurase